MKISDIRQAFLDYFEQNQHKVISSSSLVPANDPTLLFVNAGMVQFKDVFLGQDKRDYQRATTIQRCVRAGGKHNDLENVGYTARHHTFFEMMGNFSFGDYFKHEAMVFAWEFLTKVLKLPEEKLWITVYEDDQETEDIWLQKIGVSSERFSRCGKADNFWSMGNTGPCGPCTEIFYDHGETIAGGPPGSPEEDGDRYIEIWNLVFMQFNRDSTGNMEPLPKPSVDTGMGLERLAAILQGVNSNYDIDLFQVLMKAIAKEINVSDHNHTSIKVIADHIRSCAFMAVDEILPSNEGRGYVMRRIIRRAIRHAYKLNFKGEFFYKIVDVLVEQMGAAYPELTANSQMVKQVLQKEEQRFAETIEQGMKILQDHLDNLQGDTIAGEVIFKLYDTYGFPYDLTADIAREKNIKLDTKGYEQAMARQQDMARASSSFKTTITQDLPVTTESEFLGYDNLNANTTISQIFVDGKSVAEITDGQEGILVMNQTSFYAESGGQTADEGYLISENAKFIVNEVQKAGDAIVHMGKLLTGKLEVGDGLITEVNSNTRAKIASNHSATHLLHAALREVLGSHVQQKGSLVTSDRLRFDFSHDGAISKNDLQSIEDLCNLQIKRNLSIETKIMNIDEAKSSGAMALFGEKYTDDVRVLSIGDFSVELCGGTHVSSTEKISLIKIISESGIASGVRRIEAVSGAGAIEFLEKHHADLQEIALLLKTNSSNATEKVISLVNQNKLLEKKLTELKEQVSKFQSLEILNQAETIGDNKILVVNLDQTDPKMLRDMAEDIKSKINSGVALLATVNDAKISLVCVVTKNLCGTIKAGDIIKNITSKIDGKGGGRPDMAQGGGNDIAALSSALSTTKDWIINEIR